MKVLYFLANWCPQCEKLSEAIANLESKITCPVERVDVDRNEELTQKFKIRGVPVMLLIVNDVEVRRMEGLPPEHDLISFFNLK